MPLAAKDGYTDPGLAPRPVSICGNSLFHHLLSMNTFFLKKIKEQQFNKKYTALYQSLSVPSYSVVSSLNLQYVQVFFCLSFISTAVICQITFF